MNSGHRRALDTMMAFSMLWPSLGSPAANHPRMVTGLPSTLAKLNLWL